MYQAEKTLKDNEGKFDAALGTEATAKIEELRKVLAEADASKESIDAAMNPLNEVMMKIGQEIYAKGGTPETEEGVNVKDNNKKEDDGTVDAEVEEK